MSQNQIIALVVALGIVLILIVGWYAFRPGGEVTTSQPPQPAPSQQQAPPQPQQP
jgi:hypothetical protein